MTVHAHVAPSGTSRVATGITRYWGIARITPLGELLAPPRLSANALRLGVQIFLVVCLWRALYAQTSHVAGLTREQAVTYAVLATLAGRMRILDRRYGRDTVLQHMHFGTVIYWFLRPLAPRRYYVLRALGDQVYGFTWALVGYAICLWAGAVSLPSSTASMTAFVVSMLLGQMILYHVMQLIDLTCFWTLHNSAALLILQFIQNLLSGSYSPLWFFPDWFNTMSSFLPFQFTLNVPLSLYAGIIPPSDAIQQLCFQGAWVVGLALLTKWLWRRAARRIISQGG